MLRTALFAAIVIVCSTAAAVAQTTFVVDSLADEIDADTGDGFCLSTPSGVCTLRAAIQQANASAGPDEIQFTVSGTFTLSIPGDDEDSADTGDLDIFDDLVITGLGPTQTIIDADGLDRVFHVVFGTDAVEFRSMTIRGGIAPLVGGDPALSTGGGILNETSAVTIIDAVITNNETEDSVAEGGGVSNAEGTLFVFRSSFVNNSASCGGGVFNAGDQAVLDNVTISGNVASCTGGGLLDGAFIGTFVNNSTIAENLPNNVFGFTDTLHLSNTLLVPAPGQNNCEILTGLGGTIDAGGNLVGLEPCDTIPVTADAEQIEDLSLDATTGHSVHRPLFGNPAIDGGLQATCDALIDPLVVGPVDQRGVTRPQGTQCDTGAVELRPAAITSAAPADALWNTAYVHTFVAGGEEGPVTFALQLPATLPFGMSLSTSGVITGTTTVLGPANFTVMMTDAVGQTANQATSITVTGTEASVTGTPPAATWNTPYNFAFSGTGNGALTYAVTVGSPPAGLAMSSAGLVSGTPTGIAGSFFRVTVTDQAGLTDFVDATITVNSTFPSVTGTPPAATWNVPYNFTFSGTGNGTLAYTVTNGSLPAGLTVSTAGVVSGTPTGLGTSSFTVTLTDQTGQIALLPTSITVTGTPVSISGLPPDALWNQAYSFTVTGTGNGTLSFVRTTGSLPPGLSLSTSGAITGTPTALGPRSFGVTVTDQTGETATQAMTINVTGTSASISGTPADATWNVGYTFPFVGVGNGTLTYAVTAGSLPAGLSLSTTGVITGTPTGIGTFSFSVTVTDQTEQAATLPTSLDVTGTTASIVGTPHNATWNSAYTFNFSGDGNGTLTYAVTTGTLPAGLSLSNGGFITGIPTGVGLSSFSVTVTDQTGQTATLAANLTVTGTTASVASTPAPPAATWGVPYTFAFTGTGNGTLTFSVTGGALPAGLTLSSAGVLSGTPTGLGNSNFAVTVTDQTSRTASRSRSITVTGTAISLSGVPTLAVTGSGYAFVFTATGNGTLTFGVTSGALPPGISLSTSGVLFGAPPIAGSYPFVVRVTDQSSQTTTLAVTVVVNAAAGTPGSPGPPGSPAPPSPPAGNAPPSVTGLSDFTIEENRPIAPITITLSDDATPPDQLQVSVAAADATILSSVSLTGTGASRTLNLTLAEDREGQATVTLLVGDGTLTTTVRARITVTPAPVPNPPTGFTGVPEGAGVRFSWQAPVVGAVPTFYVLEGGNQTGLVTLPVVNTGRATNYLLIVPAGTWFFRVRSGNSAGVSVPTAELSGTMGGSPTPGAPQALVSAVTGVVAQLAWQPPQEGGPASQWQIEVGSTPGASDRIVVRLPASVFAIQSALDPGQYVARVRGVGATGVGPASNETSFTIGAVAACALGIADPPVLLPATVANRLVTLMWRPPTNSAVSNYRIVVGSAPGISDLITFNVGTVTSFAAVAPPGQYFVRLLATNACGTSLPSNEIFVAVP